MFTPVNDSKTLSHEMVDAAIRERNVDQLREYACEADRVKATGLAKQLRRFADQIASWRPDATLSTDEPVDLGGLDDDEPRMKLTIDIGVDWLERFIRAGADDGSNDAEYDLLCAVAEQIDSAMRAAGHDMAAIDVLRERRDNGEWLNA